MSTLTQAFVTAALTEETNLNEAFTRQHYEAIAKLIKAANDEMETKAQGEIIEELADKLAAYFAADNSRFDKGFFLSKCGL